MQNNFRRASVAVAAVTSIALTGLAVSPAQASNDGQRFTRNTSTRTFDLAFDRADASLASSTAVPVGRLAGSDRIDTAIQTSNALWDDATAPDGNKANAVILSRSDEYADALGGSALAGAAGGPLLLTRSARLDTSVEAEISRVLAKPGLVYLLGGTGALSSTVESRLKGLGYTVKRLEGADRFATSVAVAQEVSAYLPPDGVPQFVMVTTGLDFPDGLAAGATAGGYHGAVVLTKGSTIPYVVDGYLNHIRSLGQQYSKHVPFFAVGGQAAAARYTWDARYVGQDRFDTAAMVAKEFWGDPSTPNDDPAAIGLATGMDWPDALAGGAFMAGGGPLVLSKTDSLPATTSSAIKTLVASGNPSPVQFGVIFGGVAVVGATAESQFTMLLNPTP